MFQNFYSIILAKREEKFAVNELQGLFDEQDYIRAREIVKTLLKNNADSLRKQFPNLVNSPDWILRELLIED